MKAYLMYRDRDLDLQTPLPAQATAVAHDLGLAVIWSAMADGDELVHEVARRAFFTPLKNPDAVGYREAALADCVANQAAVRRLYQTTVEAVQAERRIWGLSTGSPQVVLYRAVDVLALFMGYLKELRLMAHETAPSFSSDAFARFFAMLASELDDEYLEQVRRHLGTLKFRGGVLVSSKLGEGFGSVDHVLRAPLPKSWAQRLSIKRSGLSFEVPVRDDGGHQVLDGLRGRALNAVANAAAQSGEHVRSFFQLVAAELAFYVGCLNLHDRLKGFGLPVCVPEVLEPGATALSADALYDPALALRIDGPVTGNEVRADGQAVIVVTGANQGGKSTFLRSLGVAQMMSQCGMFVAAERFRASARGTVFTHFRREEDATMQSGKLDEELARMSGMAASVRPGDVLLCNESFASTNEQEGSEIAREIVRAFSERDVRVVYVTHMFELASQLRSEPVAPSLFLRAERLDDGRRTFRVVEGAPLPTSHGRDSYERIFGNAARDVVEAG